LTRRAGALRSGVTFRFNDATRHLVAERCAAFTRVASRPADHLKHAAVAITLTDAADGSGETALILTGRVAGLRSHGGQWAMPGGRIDAGETPTQGALRELAEEIGLELTPDDIIGTLDDYPTRSGYLITPVVVWGGDHAPLRLNPAEVASIRRIRLVDIAREDAIEFDTIPESKRRVVRLNINGRFIHAPTAALIYQFREVLAGRATRVADLEQPVFAWR
jgi:8-oxo-dGTP pyrophosphatase MutT (NUDIX family)